MLPTVMNPTSTDPTAPPPPPPPQPPRSSFSCDRHPAEQFTGFCPSCLCERLVTLDNSSSNTPSSSRRPSSASAAAAAAIKSLFSSTSKPTSFPPPPPPPKPSRPPSSFPELRRTKSFSASKNEALGQFFEPQRKSCDVRARNTLWTLFTLDDENKVGGGGGGSGNKPSSIGAAAGASSHQNSKKTGSFDKPVFEETENEEDFRDPANLEDDVVCDDADNVDGDEIRSHLGNSRNAVEFEVNTGEIVEEEREEAAEAAARVANLKIKDHIDLDNNQEKKSSGGGFWAAASVFSKKWQKWRRKQKIKKQNNGESFTTLPVEKPISRQYRETQSEIADYGYGRRSCDTDPRFSLDAGRMSFDDAARHSFDEPRASWDGYLMGRSFPRMAPMVSLMEDAPAAAARPDMHIPVEDDRHHPPPGGEGGVVPGGTTQTREYYLDSSCRRRKSLDRCSSTRKAAASVVAEIDELKMVSNAKVSPTTADCFHGARELRDSNSQSLRDDSFELGGSGYRDYSNSSIGNGETKETKKARRWSWRIWGFKFIHRRSGSGGGGNKEEEDDEEEKYSRVNGVGRSLSVSWQDGRSEEGARLNINMFRSNSSVSCRNGGLFGSMRKPSGEVSVPGKLERNRSARYSSPSHVENGMWRFYLTPMRGSRRGGLGGGGGGKIKHNNSNSIARSVLRLY